MTGAELDTRRRALGLSIDELAAVCGGVQDRTVRRWTAGTSPIPTDAADRLDALEETMERNVDAAVGIATEVVDSGPVRLWRFRTQADMARSRDAHDMPLGAHAITIAWVADALAAEGIETVIGWADVG